jgi:hypothetical protein
MNGAGVDGAILHRHVHFAPGMASLSDVTVMV